MFIYSDVLFNKNFQVNPERIVKLLTILEKNIRDVITVDGGLPLILPFFEDVGLKII